jgi:hypothetical protein
LLMQGPRLPDRRLNPLFLLSHIMVPLRRPCRRLDRHPEWGSYLDGLGLYRALPWTWMPLCGPEAGPLAAVVPSDPSEEPGRRTGISSSLSPFTCLS